MKRCWILLSVLLLVFLWTDNLWAEVAKQEIPICPFGEIIEVRPNNMYQIQLNQMFWVEMQEMFPEADYRCFQKLHFPLLIRYVYRYFEKNDIINCGYDPNYRPCWKVFLPIDKGYRMGFDLQGLSPSTPPAILDSFWFLFPGTFEWCVVRASVDALTYLEEQPENDLTAKEIIRLYKVLFTILHDLDAKKIKHVFDEPAFAHPITDPNATLLFPNRILKSTRHKAIISFSQTLCLLERSEIYETLELEATGRRLKEAIGRYIERMASEEKVLEVMYQELRKQELNRLLIPKEGDAQ